MGVNHFNLLTSSSRSAKRQMMSWKGPPRGGSQCQSRRWPSRGGSNAEVEGGHRFDLPGPPDLSRRSNSQYVLEETTRLIDALDEWTRGRHEQEDIILCNFGTCRATACKSMYIYCSAANMGVVIVRRNIERYFNTFLALYEYSGYQDRHLHA
ncbi:uncharacterized protein [Triticum aestivum]|uniref:uncharacterized protein isoform X2 n=1 Tax=Triticum aestivum TaxID=4565 RepID=UPI001D017741|nr:uncharacterized protein LOC123044073 isoform X2 [Triticum aestivum]